MDFLLIIAIIVVIALVAVLIIQQNKVKAVLNDIEKDRNALEEKEKNGFEINKKTTKHK